MKSKKEIDSIKSAIDSESVDFRNSIKESSVGIIMAKDSEIIAEGLSAHSLHPQSGPSSEINLLGELMIFN